LGIKELIIKTVVPSWAF